MVDSILNFIFLTLKNVSKLFTWLNTPLITRENIGLGWLILERLGVDITFIFRLTPLEMIGGSLVLTLTTILVIKFVGMILDAIPVFGG